jgi:hypothetical protein
MKKIFYLSILLLAVSYCKEKESEPKTRTETVYGNPVTLLNGNYNVAAGSHLVNEIDLSQDSLLSINISCNSDCAKGYNVYLIEKSEYVNFQTRKRSQVFSNFTGERLLEHSYSDSDRVTAGKYLLIVQNSENIMNTMTVTMQGDYKPEETITVTE